MANETLHDYSPEALLRECSRERAWLRELLARVAQDLEHVAGRPGLAEEDRRGLLQSAARVRARMLEGPPEGWVQTGAPGSDRRDEEVPSKP